MLGKNRAAKSGVKLRLREGREKKVTESEAKGKSKEQILGGSPKKLRSILSTKSSGRREWFDI